MVAAKHRVDVSQGVQVGAHHFPIKADKSITLRLKEGAFYGRCYNRDKQLLVDGTLADSKFTETVMHEIIEAVNDVYCHSQISHRSISGMANGMTQALDSVGISFTHKARGSPDKERRR